MLGPSLRTNLGRRFSIGYDIMPGLMTNIVTIKTNESETTEQFGILQRLQFRFRLFDLDWRYNTRDVLLGVGFHDLHSFGGAVRGVGLSGNTVAVTFSLEIGFF